MAYDDEEAPRRRRSRLGLPFGRPLRALIAAVVAVAAVLALLTVMRVDFLPDWANPFSTEEKDRTGPAVLKSIRDLSRYEAAVGDYQVIVDLEEDARFLPDALRGERTLYVGTGSVSSYVDFERLADDAVTVNEERTAVTIRLPRARLDDAVLDVERSYVHARERGLFDRFGEFFSDNPNGEQELQEVALDRISTAAEDSGLTDRAEQNTEAMLTNFLGALEFTSVTVEFVSEEQAEGGEGSARDE